MSESPGKQFHVSGFLARTSQLFGVGGFLLLALAFFAISADNFFTPANTVNVLSTISVLGIVAIGQTFVLVSGGFDLSVSGTVPLGGIVFTVVSNAGHGVLVATLAAVAVGLAVGALNAFVINVVGINPLVTTLATLSIFAGFAFVLSGGLTIPVQDLNAGPMGDRLGGMPIYVWVLIAVAIVGWLTLRYTVYGRSLYAMGGNAEAARLAGLRTQALTASVYTLSGGMASFAGVMLAQQLLAGSPAVGGQAALVSITAVILGGASLTGGTGGVPGTILGVLLLGVVANGMAIMQVPAFYQQIATGVMLLLAVGLGRIRAVIERASLREVDSSKPGPDEKELRERETNEHLNTREGITPRKSPTSDVEVGGQRVPHRDGGENDG
ncbi:MAG TPA: ABC transporter permease [Acidimicrobiia bacterium]|nr:ABC transporter permease [Acidimicrobiia bacterium]